MLVYWLDLSPHDTRRWVGWRVTTPERGPYREEAFATTNLDALPAGGCVYLAGIRWTRTDG